MRKNSALIEHDTYTPNHMLDVLMTKLRAHSDAALARALSVPPSTISKVRSRQMPVNSSLLLAAHDATEISIRDLRLLLGDTGTRYWVGSIGTQECKYRMPAFFEQRHHEAYGTRMRSHEALF